MNRKHLLAVVLSAGMAGFIACNSGDNNKGSTATDTTGANTAGTSTASEGTNPKGIGPHTNIELTHPLDEKMIAEGKSIYDVKCSSCHKTTGEKLVGPGWKDVTKRRDPVWIMNMITNVDMMLASDPEAQKLLEQCLVRMPNQNISKDDARELLEYMRSNDGEK